MVLPTSCSLFLPASDFQVSDQIQIIFLDNLKDSSECSAADVALPGTESGVGSIGPLEQLIQRETGRKCMISKNLHAKQIDPQT